MRRLSLLAVLALAACKPEAPTSPVAASAAVPQAVSAPLRVGVTKVPHADLVRAAAAELKLQGLNVELKEFDDYARANIAVARGDLDANFFQTEPYLWRWRAAHSSPLVVAGRVHVEPMAVYSAKYKSLDELKAGVKAGDSIALPDDAANQGRALMLLQRAGLLRVDDRRGLDATVHDVVENKLGFKFRIDPAHKVPAQLSVAAAVVLNGNFALQAKLDPKAALFAERGDSPFPNVVVAREDRAQDPRVKALVNALRSQPVKDLIQKKYAGAVIPAE